MLNLRPIEYVGKSPRAKPRARKRSGGFFGGWFLLMLVVGIGFFYLRPIIPFLQSQRAEASTVNKVKAIEGLQNSDEFSKKLAAAALKRTAEDVEYDPGYYDLAYPGGDLPDNKGVSTDLIVRSYRALGVDLQQLVHEDMSEHFRLYPQLWERKGPDRNIDHRRVPNLQRYFSRFGKVLDNSHSLDDYDIGDVVTWSLPYGAAEQAGSHIGIIVPGPGARSGEKWVVHNIGSGPKWEDKLFDYEIAGHFRFGPIRESMTAAADTKSGAPLKAGAPLSN
tara:strand:- start:5044 stop:5877 length:834 start_codon:yes stop_codon:yes gene_type:complete